MTKSDLGKLFAPGMGDPLLLVLPNLFVHIVKDDGRLEDFGQDVSGVVRVFISEGKLSSRPSLLRFLPRRSFAPGHALRTLGM